MAGLVGGDVANRVDSMGKNALFGIDGWVGYTFGSLFIVLGLAIFATYPKAKRSADRYKKEQLEEYNKVHNSNVTDYDKTRMFLPAWQKAKQFAPALFGMVFIIMGIGWMVGNGLSTS